ncbi:MAG: tRNA1(Val) (adenine(37)-N6)-methyltransferase [Clostridia bacterium]|nr:tRNA1(Val) (adenine(37)-N6)-methyltransferase [Clostridia bacterium]
MTEHPVTDICPEAYLKDGERLDDLQCNGLKLIQKPDAFRFGTDSVLLADFASPRRNDRAVDLGCGTGAIALLMAAHCPGLKVDAVEIQPEIADMAHRSVLLNRMEETVAVHEMDMRGAWRTIGAGMRSLVVCNPPYGRSGAALESLKDAKRIARHEGDLTPSDIARSASMLLKNGGRFCVIYPAPRAFEMMQAMQENHLAPKRIRTVHGVEGRAPKFVLMDAVKGGGSGLHWLEPLVLRHPDGTFTSEWHRIYDPKEQ